MIACLKGTLMEMTVDTAIVDVNGVGYRLFVPDAALDAPAGAGDDVFFYVYTHVRDDAIHLYGFWTEAQKRLFETVLGVGGVGPRLALSILSHATVEQFLQAVVTKDERRLTQIPGIGKKIAARLLLELKDKFKDDVWTDAMIAGTPSEDAKNAPGRARGIIGDVVDALVGLGYHEEEARRTLEGIDDLDECTVEELITLALSQLDRGA